VHQSALIGRTDVHSGALPNRLESLENAEVASGLIVGHGVRPYLWWTV
jgi:hypothetical protein